MATMLTGTHLAVSILNRN